MLLKPAKNEKIYLCADLTAGCVSGLVFANNGKKNQCASANMVAIVTSLSLPAGPRLGFGVMVRINGYDYILSFGLEKLMNFSNYVA